MDWRHDVPLAPTAVAILRAITRRDDRDYVFGSGDGPFQGWSNAKAALDERISGALCKNAGAPAKLKPWRIHDLRRYRINTIRRYHHAVEFEFHPALADKVSWILVVFEPSHKASAIREHGPTIHFHVANVT